MAGVREINLIEDLGQYRPVWGGLLAETPGASFFQSLDWLEVYWRHFGAKQKLRAMVVLGDDGRPTGVVPLVVRRESTRVGRLRVLTYPLANWGSFYGPIGPSPQETLAAALEHVRHSRRDWDVLELRWLGAPGADPRQTEQAMRAAGLQAYRTIWDRTAVVEPSGGLSQFSSDENGTVPLASVSGGLSQFSSDENGTVPFKDAWDAYFSGRPRAWRRNYRHTEKKLAQQGKIEFVRHRPRGLLHGDGDPRWDLYDACETIAGRSWQAAATNGTTLTHESVRSFLREAHAAAAAAGAADINLLLLAGRPVAFAYCYQYRGYVYGLRIGFDAQSSCDGAGTLLLGESIRDSFARGDRLYDLGIGSPESKRYFRTGVADIFRCGHYHPAALRTQLLRVKRWAEHRRAGSIAVGRVQDGTADAR